MLKINKSILSNFIDNYFGYGNLDGSYWFIGKEEGGGVTLEENFERILTWERSGENHTEDLATCHYHSSYSSHKLSRIQPTWTKLCQILLTIEGKDPINIENRRQCQVKNLGNIKANNCCIELMPMASRNTSLWLWQDIFNEYFGFKDRKDYFDKIVPRRVKKIKSLILKHKPKVVVFYSSQASYIDKWSKIAQTKKWKWVTFEKYFKYGWVVNNGVLFIITPHPTAYGIKNTDFPKVGEFIKLHSL